VSRGIELPLRTIVELRWTIREVRDRAVRARLRTLEVALRRALGPAIPKRRAAAALGVSVPALDHWIERGRLPVVARAGSSRLSVETGPLLDLLEQVVSLREQGVRRGLLAAAFSRLGVGDDPEGRQVLAKEVAELPRANVSVLELRDHRDRTTPEERVREVAAISQLATSLASGR
jgi:DNA-binding transcriptional MerR regulator